MITVEEVDKIISGNVKEFPPVSIRLEDAYGMVLREDLMADRDLPPFDRVMMDGIAIDFAAWEKGVRTFAVEGVQGAGQPPLSLKHADGGIEIMTGAVVPEGCDCIIPVEDYDMDDGKAVFNETCRPVRLQNIHGKGSDAVQGTRFLEGGIRLSAPQIAVAASIGKSKILVSVSPKIAVIGTGDELVSINEVPQPHQIRQSNVYALQSALELNGFKHVTRFHLRDDKKELTRQIGEMLQRFDVLVLIGGVSKGKFDYVPEVLENIGVKQLFHKVQQRPGKPFWFGINSDGKPVFALPGNPVSSQIGLYRHVLPYLEMVSGIKIKQEEFAVLDRDVKIETSFTCFLPVKLKNSPDGILKVQPVVSNNSGDNVSLSGSDGFVELPGDTVEFGKGAVVRLYRW